MFQGLNQRIMSMATNAMSAVGLLSKTEPENRVPFDENLENGLMFKDVYIPEELLAEILCHVDHKSLLACQLVCRRWNDLLQTYVWRKKTEKVLGHTLPVDKHLPPSSYYLLCEKKPFERNLIKNHSGESGINVGWQVDQYRNQWTIECPPVGVPPLPDDPVFEGKESCFVTSFNESYKQQIIDLVAEGLTPYVLDVLQPTIEISEWVSARWDCPAIYRCTVRLLKEKSAEKTKKNSKLHFTYSKILENDEQNVWVKVSHEFKNYGPGVRKVLFSHAGQDRSFWQGHYGSKMAGGCVKVKMPS